MISRRPNSAPPSTDVTARIVALWQAGLDTYAIGLRLDVKEYDVERLLHAWKDARRRG